jgi:hypothetical protein
MRTTALRIAFLALVAGTLGGCTLAGPPATGPGRQVGWYGYVGGSDIRQSCLPGADDHVRFVYQATYARQVRGYELVVARGADVGSLRSQAWGPPALLSFGGGGPSLGGPVESRAVVEKQDLARIEAALRESRFDAPAPVGALLRSDRYFWTVAACRGGVFHFNAYLLDLDEPRQPAFAAALFGFDQTGVPVRPPEPTGGPLIVRDARRASPDLREDLSFQLPVGTDGLDMAGY